MVQEILSESDFLWSSCSTLKKSSHFENYDKWIKSQHHGDMTYLESHLPAKQDPASFFSGYESIISVGISYLPHPAPKKSFAGASVALYAQGLDYHHWFKDKLEKCAQELKLKFPAESFLCCTDSAPLQERDLAVSGGVGWIGKNTCLITRQDGSLFLIGEILTSLKFSPDQNSEPQPPHDFCGTCNLCLEACPTKAFVEPRVLDATKCISYWTIESRKIPPEPLRTQIQDWLFGCDICQTVCPWNKKILQKFLPQPQAPDEQALIEDLRWILTASGKQIEKRVKGTPLLRAGPFGLRRNALIVAGNLGLRELLPLIKTLSEDPRLGELAQWALAKING